MPRFQTDYNSYRKVAFLDANIILECKSLDSLPWEILDPDGPILLVVSPTGMSQIDALKRDGRIGPIARQFNRLISPFASGGKPIPIKRSNPCVELALSFSNRIPWADHDDLDPNDGDSKIVAEIIHARDVEHHRKVLVSYDIKPIALATGYEIQTIHVSEDWLKPPEPHPKDRKIQQLKAKLSAHEKKEPAFEVSAEMHIAKNFRLVQITEATTEQKDQIENQIFSSNRKRSQFRGSGRLQIPPIYHDQSYDERYEEYTRKVSEFVDSYSEQMEKLLNQVQVEIKVTNVGNVQAENLLIEIESVGGTLNDRFVFIPPKGPSAPEPREEFYIPPYKTMADYIPSPVGRHEFEYKDFPSNNEFVSQTCQDFRKGQIHRFNGVFRPQVNSTNDFQLKIRATASNFTGETTLTKRFDLPVIRMALEEVVDLSSLKLKLPLPMQDLIDAERFDEIDLEALETDYD